MTAALVAALLAGLAGVIFGSFIAALTWRWPRGASVAAGRSRCDSCAAPLSALELVPLVSFAVQRGRCRHCGAAIPPRHLAIELAAGSVAALSIGLHPGVAGLVGAGFGLVLLTLAILDAEHFWLPDVLTLPLGLAGIVSGVWLAPVLAERAIGAAAGFASLALIAAAYRWRTGRTGMGGGDPKLLAAIGAWLGWMVLPAVVLAAASLGLALALFDRWRGRDITGQTRLPLGALLAGAAWVVWLVGPVLPPP